MRDKAGALLLANESRYQPDLLIKEWQKTVLSGKCEPADKSLVTELCGQCCYVLREFVRPSKDADISQNVSNNLRRSYGSLKLWDDAFQVSQGKLDEVLDRNKAAKHATLRILSNIARSLVKIALVTPDSRKIPNLAAKLQQALQVVPWNGNDEEGGSMDDDDSDSYSESDFDDLDELAMNIATGVDCLMDLEQLYNSPTLDSEPDVPAVITTAEWKPEQSYCDRISQRFPEADINLVLRLGRANYYRYLRSIGARATADEEREYEVPKVVASGAGSSAHVSVFHDSGVGSSVPTASYAETVMSYAREKGNTVRVPPLSEDAKNGLPFQCIACGKQVRIRHNWAWKQHLVSDLQPYICLDMSCPSDEVFQNLGDWTTHIISAHLQGSETRSCPLCMEQMRYSLLPVIQHLRRHLEEISLASLPVGGESDSDSDSSSVFEEYEVDEVLDEQPNPDIPGTILYLVRWKDSSLPECTWEPEENLSRDLRDHWEKTKKHINVGLRKPHYRNSYEAAGQPARLPIPSTRNSSRHSEERVQLPDIPHFIKVQADLLEESFDSPSFEADEAPPAETAKSEDSTSYIEPPVTRNKAQCWEHGCNGREFDTFHSLEQHREANFRWDNTFTWPETCRNCGSELIGLGTNSGRYLCGDCEINMPSLGPSLAIPSGPMEKLAAITSHFDAKLLPLCKNFMRHPPKDAKKLEDEHRKITQAVMQCVLLKLDEVDTGGDPDIRARRKDLVNCVQAVLKAVDRRLVSNNPNHRHVPSPTRNATPVQNTGSTSNDAKYIVDVADAKGHEQVNMHGDKTPVKILNNCERDVGDEVKLPKPEPIEDEDFYLDNVLKAPRALVPMPHSKEQYPARWDMKRRAERALSKLLSREAAETGQISWERPLEQKDFEYDNTPWEPPQQLSSAAD